MAKCDREIMEILEAFDLTSCAWTAAQLSGCDAKTVARYVARREAGRDPLRQAERPKLVDAYGAKLEEWVERSRGAVRSDVVHQRLRALGYLGDERTTRRAVARAKRAWGQGHRRSYRPWVPEPGMWLQYDWGKGPEIGGRGTALFCAWLAWSRYRVIVPTWDQTLGSLLPALDCGLRRFGGCPTYWLTDNARTVTLDRIAGIPVRHPELVRAARHYGAVGEAVWCRLEGEELVAVARTAAGLEEIARHRASTPGRPQILPAHYPNHPDGRESLHPRARPRTRRRRRSWHWAREPSCGYGWRQRRGWPGSGPRWRGR